MSRSANQTTQASFWRTLYRRLIRGLLVGTLSTYLSSFIVIWLLPPISRTSWLESSVGIEVPGHTSTPILMRDWIGHGGEVFQIKPASASERHVIAGPWLSPPPNPASLDSWPGFEVLPPRWTHICSDWPGTIQPTALPAGGGCLYEIRVGWPFSGLYGRYQVVETPGASRLTYFWGGIPLRRKAGYAGPWQYITLDTLMPVVPLWPAFVYSVLFYGGSLELFLGARRRIRRLLHHPDHCLQCGYNLTGTRDAGIPVCPECGTAVSHWR